jgi:hypothetical protein
MHTDTKKRTGPALKPVPAPEKLRDGNWNQLYFICLFQIFEILPQRITRKKHAN